MLDALRDRGACTFMFISYRDTPVMLLILRVGYGVSFKERVVLSNHPFERTVENRGLWLTSWPAAQLGR